MGSDMISQKLNNIFLYHPEVDDTQKLALTGLVPIIRYQVQN